MLYKIDYTIASEDGRKVATKWINHAADQTQAVKRMMNWFFENNPNSKIRLDSVMGVEITGDMSAVDVIDVLAKPHPIQKED